MNKYLTIQNLIQKMATDDKALIDISISDKSGKLRKINKTCILNIYKYLLREKNKEEVEVVLNETDISLE
jgi:hypothetical protein